MLTLIISCGINLTPRHIYKKKKNVKFIPFPEGVWNFKKNTKKTVENDRVGMILSQEPEMVRVKISVSKTS